MTTTTSARTWSSQQEIIFTETVDGNGHFIVVARAGTGKTTTIVEAVKRFLAVNPGKRVVICAFNKRIAEELVQRLAGFDVTVKTLHALGFSAVLRYWSRVRPVSGSERADKLADRVCGSKAPDAVKRLVSKLHTKAREIEPHARQLGELSGMMIQFECEPDEVLTAEGFDAEYIELKALEAMELAATEKPADGVIDFADMIFLPVRNRWLTKQFDLVLVDEAQDMTKAQLEIAQGVCRGRIGVVGDDMQAIYGFRGADSGSLSRLKTELNAREMGLTTTYRCGRAIVAEANRYVPDFYAGANNPEGAISDLDINKLVSTAEHGDFILSRANAPLVPIAMKLLRDGKRARIAGRDIGAGLRNIIRKLAKGAAANSVPAFIDKVGAWRDKEIARLLPQLKRESTANAAQSKMDLIGDQAEMLVELAEGALSVRDVETRIDSLFTDDGLGAKGVITCSSVHRSKGLEADRVFILSWTLRETNQEERNICYVAITRAKESLVYVTKGAAA